MDISIIIDFLLKLAETIQIKRVELVPLETLDSFEPLDERTFFNSVVKSFVRCSTERTNPICNNEIQWSVIKLGLGTSSERRYRKRSWNN